MEDMYSITEVAEKLSVSDKTVRNWVTQGKIKAYRFGLAYRIKAVDLQDFIDNSQVKGENEND